MPKNEEELLDWFKRFFHFYSTKHESIPGNIEYEFDGCLLVKLSHKDWECECRIPGMYTGGPSNIFVRLLFLRDNQILGRIYKVVSRSTDMMQSFLAPLSLIRTREHGFFIEYDFGWLKILNEKVAILREYLEKIADELVEETLKEESIAGFLAAKTFRSEQPEES